MFTTYSILYVHNILNIISSPYWSVCKPEHASLTIWPCYVVINTNCNGNEIIAICSSQLASIYGTQTLLVLLEGSGNFLSIPLLCGYIHELQDGAPSAEGKHIRKYIEEKRITKATAFPFYPEWYRRPDGCRLQQRVGGKSYSNMNWDAWIRYRLTSSYRWGSFYCSKPTAAMENRGPFKLNFYLIWEML